MGRMLTNATVAIVKESGERFENLDVNIDGSMVLIEDVKKDIEEGDLLELPLPNGSVEVSRIVDREYEPGHHGFGECYRCRIQKLSKAEADKAVQSITYNLNAPGARVYANSVDNSINVYQGPADELFRALGGILEKSIQDEAEREELLGDLEALEESVGTADYQSRYKSFVALAADHVTLIAPFIPALSQLL